MDVLYKYRSFSERTDEIILDKKVWLAKPSTLNDPFECQLERFDEEKLKKYIEDSKEWQYFGFLANALLCKDKKLNFYGIEGRKLRIFLNRLEKLKTLQQRYEFANKLMVKSGVGSFTDPTQDARSLHIQLGNVGIFSLSEDPANMQMWSHYGDSHKGVALGFSKEKSSKLSNRKYCREIHYKNDMSEFDFAGESMAALEIGFDNSGRLIKQSSIPLDDPQVQNAMFTKTTGWEYEKEWRYLEYKYGSYDFPGPLTEVIFGLSANPDNIKKFIELCKNNIDYDIQFKRIVRVQGSTELKVVDFLERIEA